MAQDIFLRAHVAQPARTGVRPPAGLKWPTRILLVDTETTIDTRQVLTLGAFRRGRLMGETYMCEDEGLFYGEGEPRARQLLESYARRHTPDVAIKSFPPKLTLPVYSRAAFIEQVFWKAVKRGDMIVAFNLPFDLSRLAVDWRTARDGGWSLILSQRRSRKTGRLEANPHRPRVRVTARNSKSAFITLMRPHDPDEWPKRGRFLDVHTLAFALYSNSFSLDGLCKELQITGKLKHEPSGRITPAELDYCREDVRATMDVLNAVKQEFDRHPLDLYPDRAFSPASIAKAYFDRMGIIPPSQKFAVPDEHLGIAMQAYYGGRAECRIRRTEVPVVHTDFKSQYPSVNALLGNWEVLIAESVTFEDATDDVRAFLARVTLDDLFRPKTWRELSFYALVRPDKDILPVRTVYHGETQNIGLNYLTADRPMWLTGPDCVNAVLQGHGKVPHIQKAIRLVPHGRQAGLTATSLRGMVTTNAGTHDFFRHVVEQREEHKTTNASLAAFLKTLGSSGSYGSFVEVTPKAQRKPMPVRLFCGQDARDVFANVLEQHGRWYFPPIAALITAGGRLLLGMLERCVTDAGGTYLFCDTDSLCIVAARRRKLVPCEGGSYQLRGQAAVKALSFADVRNIADRFAALNPYDRAHVRGSILKIEDVNFDEAGNHQQLFGFAVSAKRYVLYRRHAKGIRLVDPKAHGLGYLYPPTERKHHDDPDWVWEAWEWMVRAELGLRRTEPAWLHLPAMMRVALSTPLVLDRINRQTRPFSFVFCPLPDPVVGYPVGVDPDRFTLIAPFTKSRDQWLASRCINVHDGREYQLALQQTPVLDRVIPQTFGFVLRLYLLHPESKSLAPDGTPCEMHTRGLLRRASIIAGAHRPIGKEADRRWEHGEDLSLLSVRPATYQDVIKMVAADTMLREQMAACGQRELMRRTGLSQHTLKKLRHGLPVRRHTVSRVTNALEQIATATGDPDSEEI